jgi:hypothetical protein
MSSNVPTALIESRLGQGLSYDDWKKILKSRGYLMNESVKKTIIKAEFEYFKPEILRLRAEPNTAVKRKDVAKTNSLESILKRLQGKEWAQGMPGEKDQRIQNRTLLGSDAK